ncbi:ABC transporter ATP-binding protein [Polynucleobacter sp. AM-7D1]|uniref:ABC transporter ATP-binding protein n=1 Tax=Polynucleobacter sp. AM-7D1 TaxID=2689102 RepID=UPI001BFE6708|nr:ABC transporter ATP-binding protein [Polynucleobacter sp. AM-7D1]QWE28984.1 ABC transporter ATP-binding protein [Polynucleobacter sp. AM-7D1]
MNKKNSIYKSIYSLWRHLSARRRKDFILLLFVMIASSFSEIIGIGALIPFLTILARPETFFDNSLIQHTLNFLGIYSSDDLIVPLSVFFGVVIIAAASMRLLFLWVGAKFSFAVGADLSINMYRRTLYQDYLTHCSRNSSEVIGGILSKVNIVIYGIVTPIISIIGASIMLLALIIALVYVDPNIALISIGGFLCIYGLIFLSVRKKLFNNGKRINDASDDLIKSIQESLGGIRDILLDGSQELYCNEYQKNDLALRKAQRDNLIISSAPRYLVEYIGIVLFAFLALWLTVQKGDILIAIPLLGALAMIAQRSLPQMQQLYSGLASLRSSHESLDDVIFLLDQKLPTHIDGMGKGLIPFNREIVFDQISFRYGLNTPLILFNTNLKISKGSWVGVVGSTGSGKSTLVDILMGLLSQTSGRLLIDGECLTSSNCLDWQKRIAHVPQAIFLKDATILENIAFGIPKNEIDIPRCISAAKQAQLSETIKDWSDGYATLVGERGVSLSGGQRQRVGIARALYKNADIIILDEATSALDAETETNVMDSIAQLDKGVTLIIIAHRTYTLKKCNQIIRVNKGGSIESLGSYRELVDLGIN